MKNTAFNSRSSEWIGDLTVWLQENADTNEEQLSRLRRNLRLAREQELTPRQQQVVTLYFDCGMTIPQIAQQLGVTPSTVSRTMHRAKEHLYRRLRYGL